MQARVFLVGLEVAAGVWTAWLLTGERVTGGTLVRFAALLAMSIGYAEIGSRSQRITRYLSSGKVFSNPMSVWSFAAVLVLPAGWAALFVAAQYTHSAVQRRRERSGNLYRVVFTAAVTMLAQLVTAGLLAVAEVDGDALRGSVVGGLAVAAGVAVFLAVNLVLLVTGMWLAAGRPSLRKLIPGTDTLATEALTLTLGIVAAEFVAHSPVLLPVTVALVVMVQRSATVKALHTAARTDGKTQLLTSAAWSAATQSMLARATQGGAAVAILLLDLDHFKRINDTLGHLAGDRVLAATAATLRRETRDRDALGRFGGEEFAVAMVGLTLPDVLAVAERIRAAVAALKVDDATVTASIGVAYEPVGSNDTTLEQLLERADAALYAAKNNGRDRTRLAPESTPQPR